MYDLIERLLSDRLWIYTGILGALVGAAFLAYFRVTRLGVWSYNKFDQALDYVRDRFGWTWFDQPIDAWRLKEPSLADKIDSLEARIKELEDGRA